MASSFRRLAKDHAALQCSLPPNYLFPDYSASLPDDLTQLLILITGAEGTPYSQGLWRLHLKMPQDYPKNPPRATFRTRIYHPNVEESTGAVCLETLKRDWDSKLTLKDILVTISCLLIQPNPDSALNSAAGALIQEDYEAFATQARLMTGIHAPIPKYLINAVEHAKRRGEEEPDDQQPLSDFTKCEPQIIREDSGEDNTKENEPAQSRSLGLKTSTKGKRPLSDIPSPSESGVYAGKSEEATDASSTSRTHESAEPPRKSPRRAGPDAAGSTEVVNIIFEDDKENAASTSDKVGKAAVLPQATAMSRPSALRKVSNVGAGRRGQPRVGIRRL
ncbi:ubiquitin-conjugating enzyme E2 S [Exophiala viscosa]|uniref:Ubiquitin-conjugating enzyme E2 S n=1 Tax=Exophiala viscosa TaxID=2486360 RepID=A0AAN6E5L8_9EURO|nr:ubiquitin-conjugating enzyme E2 S [Exophiala viscosa]KAI1629408.1 ubiquitin-conjugating enzyme E2 S [Exophiala viscosa]